MITEHLDTYLNVFTCSAHGCTWKHRDEVPRSTASRAVPREEAVARPSRTREGGLARCGWPPRRSGPVKPGQGAEHSRPWALGLRSPAPPARPAGLSAPRATAAPPLPAPRDLAGRAHPRRRRGQCGLGSPLSAPPGPAGPLAPASPVGGQQRLVDQHDEEGARPVEERRQQLGHPGGQPAGGGVRARAIGLAGHARAAPAARLGPTPGRPAPVPSPPRRPERAQSKQEGAQRTPRVGAASRRPKAAGAEEPRGGSWSGNPRWAPVCWGAGRGVGGKRAWGSPALLRTSEKRCSSVLGLVLLFLCSTF